MPATAEIITIGDEILYGQTLDTNSHWISGELDAAGILVTRKVAIGDDKQTILKTLEEAENRSDIVLVTGGLGPTNDDLTKPCLVEYFDTELVRNEEALRNIESLFAKAGREMNDLNAQQADMPANCEVVDNLIGTAPGMWFERNGKVVVSMPGVPYEMKKMMTDSIIPKLQEKYVEGGVYHRMIRTVGVPESKLADQIKEWEQQLPSTIKLAYLPTTGSVKLRLTSKGNDENQILSALQEQIDKVLPLIQKHVYGFDGEEIEEAIGRLLKSHNKTIAVAESCTGGYLSHKITSVPGSSKWFIGSFVPYSNQLKNEQLHVPLEVLEKHGAVSEPVVLALAENVRKEFRTDVGVSVSGIAGPGGGTKEKPVGTVWIAYADGQKSVAKEFHFTKNRNINIQFTAMAALNMIRMHLE